ncbi:Uncharacterised protein [Klebsiella pneumoniae]|nr:Uncharacterised protein [Klebsiella pneumoniae]
MTDKNTPAQEAIAENATLLKILGRLLSALDAFDQRQRTQHSGR